jgi:hypothetical protein
MTIQDCEGIASAIHERAELDVPIDPWKVVASFKNVRVAWGHPHERPHVEYDEEGPVIVLTPNQRRERQGFALLHELAHLLLAAHGVQNDDEHADWLAGAILLPRDHVLRALRRGTAIEELVEVHKHASQEAIVRRVVALSTGRVAWVWDAEPVARDPYKLVTPGWRWSLKTPTPLEWDAMRRARETRSIVEDARGGVRAWVAEDRPWIRVFCLSDAETLLARTTGVSPADYTF